MISSDRSSSSSSNTFNISGSEMAGVLPSCGIGRPFWRGFEYTPGDFSGLLLSCTFLVPASLFGKMSNVHWPSPLFGRLLFVDEVPPHFSMNRFEVVVDAIARRVCICCCLFRWSQCRTTVMLPLLSISFHESGGLSISSSFRRASVITSGIVHIAVVERWVKNFFNFWIISTNLRV